MDVYSPKYAASRLGRALTWMLVLVMLLSTLAACGSESGDNSEKQSETGESAQKQESQETEEPTVAREDGWYVDEDGRVFYYLGGVPRVGFFQNREQGEYQEQSFGEGWYYFSSDGVMQRACWVEEKGDTYYFTESGLAAEAGWYADDCGWYYLGERGMLYRSVDLSQEGSTYSVDENGYLYQVKHNEVSCVKETSLIGDGYEVECLVPETPVERCRELLFCTATDNGNSLAGNSGWILWLRTDGVWRDMAGEFDVVPGMDCFTVCFHEPVSFDGFYAKPMVTNADLIPVLADVVIEY